MRDMLLFPELAGGPGSTADRVRVTEEEEQRVIALVHRRRGVTVTELSREVARMLGWFDARGRPLDRRARRLLYRLETQGRIPPLHRRSRKPRRAAGTGSPSWWVPEDILETRFLIGGPYDPETPLEARTATTPFEVSVWKTLVHRLHPLGHRGWLGRRMLYFVTPRGEPHHLLSLWGFASPAYRVGVRDHRLRRLGLQDILGSLAVFSRFLLLVEPATPETALAMVRPVMQRLPEDWERHYGARLQALELYLTEEEARDWLPFYQALGFRYLGRTRGYAKKGNRYYAHGRPKSLFLLPLNPDLAEALDRDLEAQPPNPPSPLP